MKTSDAIGLTIFEQSHDCADCTMPAIPRILKSFWGLHAGAGLSFVCLLCLLMAAEVGAQNQDAAAKSSRYGQWLGALGGSGLRRSVANGSDLGELINRATTYRLGQQLQSGYLANPANGGSLAGFSFATDVDGVVAQGSSFIAIEKSAEGKHSVIDFHVRRALRKGDYIDAVSDRIDLGFLKNHNYFANGAGYFGLNLILEQTDADVKFVNGERSGDAYGLRLQTGEVL